MTSLVPLGACFGSLTIGRLASKGRKNALIFSDVLGILAVLMCLMSIYLKQFTLLVIGRFIVGIFVGI